MFRRAHSPGLHRELALLDNPVGGFFHPFAPATSADACSADNQPARCVSPISVGGELVAFFETNTRRIIGIINRNCPSAVFLHHSKARHVGWPVTNVNHILERNRPNFRVHVIVHVLRHIEKAFINPKKETVSFAYD
jgi:hypothetical protein